MSLLRSVALCALVVLATVFLVHAADDAVDDHDVIVLTDDNFDDIVNKEELILVEFYAPWCGHCKHLAPEYAKAATELLKHDPPIPIAKVDATVQSKTAGRFSVSGYPTLKVFRNGKESPYNGPRKADGIVSYMKKQVGPAAKALNSIKDVEAFSISDPVNGFAVVGFFSGDGKNSQLHSSFQVVASKMRDNYIFGKVTDPAIAKHFGLDSGEGLVAFKNYDDKKTIYTGSPRTKDVEDWIKANSFPVVGELTEENQELYMKRDLPIAKFFLNVDKKVNPKQYDYYANRLRKIATEYAGKLSVATLYMPKWEHAVTAYNLKGKQDGFVIEKGYEEKYKMDGTFSLDNIKKFVADYFDGELDEYVKSEDVPKDNTGPVKTVVGKTFNDIVNDDSKDVMIEFYAPWCGHCKSLAPKYEELGKKFKGVDSVVIAKLDATANDFPRDDFKVSGYPTIFFKPAKAGAKPKLYEGAREVDAMESFIRKEGKSAALAEGKKKKKKNE